MVFSFCFSFELRDQFSDQQLKCAHVYVKIHYYDKLFLVNEWIERIYAMVTYTATATQQTNKKCKKTFNWKDDVI